MWHRSLKHVLVLVYYCLIYNLGFQLNLNNVLYDAPARTKKWHSVRMLPSLIFLPIPIDLFLARTAIVFPLKSCSVLCVFTTTRPWCAACYYFMSCLNVTWSISMHGDDFSATNTALRTAFSKCLCLLLMVSLTLASWHNHICGFPSYSVNMMFVLLECSPVFGSPECALVAKRHGYKNQLPRPPGTFERRDHWVETERRTLYH